MIPPKYHIELLTPCFCAGANPKTEAEIRVPSIRGQLRWWYRTLGGFKSLAPACLPEQETMIFGGIAGSDPTASKLILRVEPFVDRLTTGGRDYSAPDMNSPEGYLLFPLRQQNRQVCAAASFLLKVFWRGNRNLNADIGALIAVWVHLGGLGFRSRRTMGALAFRSDGHDLGDSLASFTKPSNIVIKKLRGGERPFDERTCIRELGNWLRSWRIHGQMNRTWKWNDRDDRSKDGRWTGISEAQRAINRSQPGFKYARRDHHEGLQELTDIAAHADQEEPKGRNGESFRPAIGLPIIQFFSSLGNDRGPSRRQDATVNWDWEWNTERPKGEGRFASPVILRPHRDAHGQWHALVIFVDAHNWPAGKKVFLNGQPRDVSLDLYEAMKADSRLTTFL